MQNLKAVAMGMVTVIAFFWSNKPNPAMTVAVFVQPLIEIVNFPPLRSRNGRDRAQHRHRQSRFFHPRNGHVTHVRTVLLFASEIAVWRLGKYNRRPNPGVN
jgi:hypothetical protein